MRQCKCVIGEWRKADIDQRHRTSVESKQIQLLVIIIIISAEGDSQSSSKHPFTLSILPWSFPLPVLLACANDGQGENWRGGGRKRKDGA